MSWGRLGQPAALLRAGERLKALGATAIAVVSRFPDDDGSEALQAYRQGSGVDGLAGAEAVISHLLSGHLGLPCAHAPALAPLEPDPRLDPRAAGEELGYTFLACVLVGLSRAPDLVNLGEAPGAGVSQVASAGQGASVPFPIAGADLARRAALADPGLLRPELIGAVVAPAGALGGGAVLACAERGVPLIAVANPCLLEVTAAALGLPALAASSYCEAAGLLLALREGISPAALSRPLAPLLPLAS